MKLKTFILLLLFSTSICFAENISRVNELRLEGASLYSRLIEIKNENDFIINGFGHSNSLPKYKQWRTDLEKLTEKLQLEIDELNSIQEKINSEYFVLQSSCNDLNGLAMRYATSGVKEDEYMKKLNKELIKVFLDKK